MDTLLFERQGKKLVLTEDGKRLFTYAEEIFSTGKEMMASFRGDPHKPWPINIGVNPSVPTSFVDSLVNFVLSLQPVRQVSVREKSVEWLLQELRLQKLDFIVTDVLPHPMSADLNSHVLDRVPVAFVAHPEVASQFPGRFPDLLNGAPLILPTYNRTLCTEVREYLSLHRITPKTVIEIDNVELAYRMVVARHGIAPINKYTATREPAQKLVILNDEPVGLYRSSYLLWKIRKKNHPVLTALLEKFKFLS